jgi:hypothetical protein
LPQGLEDGLFLGVVAGALLVVLFLLEQAEALALEGLGALAVGAALDAGGGGGKLCQFCFFFRGMFVVRIAGLDLGIVAYLFRSDDIVKCGRAEWVGVVVKRKR